LLLGFSLLSKLIFLKTRAESQVLYNFFLRKIDHRRIAGLIFCMHFVDALFLLLYLSLGKRLCLKTEMFLRSLINMYRVINKLRTCVCSDKHYNRTKFCTHFTKYLQEFNMTIIVTWTFFYILVRYFFQNLV
jgi:hypothetical protein